MDNKDFHKGIRCTKLAREYTRLHLAQHGWNIADAYNRLSVGKGLLSYAAAVCRLSRTRPMFQNWPHGAESISIHGVIESSDT